MRRAFEFGGRAVGPGERATIDLALPNQSTYMPMAMPVHVVHGRREGPSLFVCASVHGDEVNGVEAVRRLIKSPAIRDVRGTLLLVPIVNVYGFVNHSRYLPDRRDLNRSFPGSQTGSLASRLAFTFTEQILKRCDYGIDLHTGGGHRTNHPHIRANLDGGETEQLARAFGTPIIINSNEVDCSVREAACTLGVKTLLFEGGGALRFEELPIRAAVRGVLNVVRELGMIRRSKPRSHPVEPVIARSSLWVRAPQSGILRVTAVPGARVERGGVFGVIADAVGENEAIVIARHESIVIGRTNLPVVNEGDALFHVGHFDDAKDVATMVDAFHAEHLTI